MLIKTIIDCLDKVIDIGEISHLERDSLWRARLILMTLARAHGLTGDDDEGLLFRMAMGEKDEDQN